MGIGRALWIAWCILWAIVWAIPGLLGALMLFASPAGAVAYLLTVGWITWIGTPLSLFAIGIGGRREVVIGGQRGVVAVQPVMPPPPMPPPLPPANRPQLPPGGVE